MNLERIVDKFTPIMEYHVDVDVCGGYIPSSLPANDVTYRRNYQAVS